MERTLQQKIFEDLTVIELSSVLAGPAVGMFLAELGAKVLKIENPKGGDITRSWKHPSEDPNNKASAYYHSVNWNKTTVFADLQKKEDNDKVCQMIRDADIVISNYRPTTATKLGMDYTSLKAFNSKLIFGQITAYGDQDDRPGFDALLQAETGWMYMNGPADGPPTKMPVALIDILAAHQLKEGLLVALIHRFKTGKGSKVSVSLYDAAVSALANQATNYLNLNLIPQRKGSLHPNIAPYGEVVRSKDGKDILLAIGSDKQFKQLCTLLNTESLCTDNKFSSNSDRVANRTLLHNKLCEAFSKQDADKLFAAAAKHEVPMGPIRHLAQLFEDPASQALILSQHEENGSESKRVKTAVFNLS